MHRIMPSFSRIFAPAILAVALAGPAIAQTPPAPAPPVPTVKILAIGEVTGAPLSAELRGKEVRATVNLYLTGKVDQWYLRGDGKGTVFLMNVATEGEAKALLDRLPMSEAGVRKFSYVPLGPMAPLRNLLMAQQER